MSSGLSVSPSGNNITTLPLPWTVRRAVPIVMHKSPWAVIGHEAIRDDMRGKGACMMSSLCSEAQTVKRERWRAQKEI